ncbi:MAG: LCP family protein [Oscillospiraceae bacterium]|nr:LCP family protein [Oscillospiraceae bacterium]MBR6595142.1 LCP family protein [Oscillospiraceae bacterium]
MNWVRKHKILTVILALLMVLMAFLGIAAGYVYSKLSLINFDDGSANNYMDELEPPEEAKDFLASIEASGPGVDISGLEEMPTDPVIPDVEIQENDDILNILLLGTDSYDGSLTKYARSDSMILVSINKTEKTVKLVSLERGMGVYMEYGEMAGQYDLLTHAFRWGGAQLVCDCVENHLRVEVDHYVRVTFSTVEKVVDAIGGIDMELTKAEANALEGMQPGMNHMNGQQALAFARLRKIDSDWQRVERQRKVILAAVAALKNASLSELDEVLNVALPMVQTDMTKLEIADLMLYAPNFLKSEFDQMTIPKQGTYGYKDGIKGFAVDYEVNSQILRDFLYGPEEEETTNP